MDDPCADLVPAACCRRPHHSPLTGSRNPDLQSHSVSIHLARSTRERLAAALGVHSPLPLYAGEVEARSAEGEGRARGTATTAAPLTLPSPQRSATWHRKTTPAARAASHRQAADRQSAAH